MCRKIPPVKNDKIKFMIFHRQRIQVKHGNLSLTIPVWLHAAKVIIVENKKTKTKIILLLCILMWVAEKNAFDVKIKTACAIRTANRSCAKNTRLRPFRNNCVSIAYATRILNTRMCIPTDPRTRSCATAANFDRLNAHLSSLLLWL